MSYNFKNTVGYINHALLKNLDRALSANNNNNIRRFIESIPQKVVEQCFFLFEYNLIYSPRQIINTTFTFFSRLFIAHKYECINGPKTKAFILII